MRVELTFTEISIPSCGTFTVSSERDTYIHSDLHTILRDIHSVLREGYLHSQRSPYHPAGHSQCSLRGILTFTEISIPSCGTFTVSSERDTYIHRDLHTILRDIHSVLREGYLHSQRSPYHPAGHSQCSPRGILTFTEISIPSCGTFTVFSERDTYIHRDLHTILQDIHSVLREGYLHSQKSPYHPAGHSQCPPRGILTFTEISIPSCGTFTVSSERDTYIHRDLHTILRDIHSVLREGYLHSQKSPYHPAGHSQCPPRGILTFTEISIPSCRTFTVSSGRDVRRVTRSSVLTFAVYSTVLNLNCKV